MSPALWLLLCYAGQCSHFARVESYAECRRLGDEIMREREAFIATSYQCKREPTSKVRVMLEVESTQHLQDSKIPLKITRSNGS